MSLETGLDNLTLTHDLVDLSILLPTDKFLVLICQFQFDSNLVGAAPLVQCNVANDGQRVLDCFIGASNCPLQLIICHIC